MFVSVASGFVFVVVLLMDKDKSKGVISGLNYLGVNNISTKVPR